MSNAETVAMLANVVKKLHDYGKTHAEIMSWIIAQTLVALKDVSEPVTVTTNEVQPVAAAPVKQAETAPVIDVRPNNQNALPTGPAAVEWKPPTNGFYRHDGRFVPDPTWKPAEKPVQERTPSVPDVLSAIQSGTPVVPQKRMVSITHEQTGFSKLVEWTPELQQQLDREAEEAKAKDSAKDTVVFVAKPKASESAAVTVRQEPAKEAPTTYTSAREHFTKPWTGPVERKE